ncbi:hypothetical protein AAVH_18234 [Aphelenchoides avenae]|nr:hypothetical protein AAVH_18234 [Aphelenchus avenae]
MADNKTYCISARSHLQSLIMQYTILSAKQYAVTLNKAEPPKFEYARLQVVSSFLKRDQTTVSELPAKISAASDKWVASIRRLPEADQYKALKQFEAFHADNNCLNIQQFLVHALITKLASYVSTCEQLLEQLTKPLSGAEQSITQPAVSQSPDANVASTEVGSKLREPSNTARNVVKQHPPRTPLEAHESCVFCSHHGHRSTHCLNYGSFEKRLLRAARRSICLACCSLRPRPHLWKACPHTPLNCAYCKQPGHHQAFCRSWLKVFPSRINRSRPQTTTKKNPTRGRSPSYRANTAASAASSEDADTEHSSSSSDDATTTCSGAQSHQPVQPMLSSAACTTEESRSIGSRPPNNASKNPTRGRATRPRTTAQATYSQAETVQGDKSDAVPARDVSGPSQVFANRPCRLLRCTCQRDDCEFIIPLPWKTTDTEEATNASKAPSTKPSLDAMPSRVQPAHFIASNPRPERPLPEPPLPPIRRGWSIARGGARNTAQRPATQHNRIKAMMSTLATRTDADMWHTCSGQLQVGADGKPFTPASADVVRYSHVAQHCFACKRSGSRYVRYRPVVLNPPPRAPKPKPEREKNTRRRSPPPQCSLTSDAVDHLSDDVSDHELGPNPPLDEQQQRALAAMLESDDGSDDGGGYEALDEQDQRALESSFSELCSDNSHLGQQRSRPSSPPGGFGPLNGLEEEEVVAPPAAVRFRPRHARLPSEPDEDTDHGSRAQQTFRGGLNADVPDEDDFYEEYFYEDDSVR